MAPGDSSGARPRRWALPMARSRSNVDFPPRSARPRRCTRSADGNRHVLQDGVATTVEREMGGDKGGGNARTRGREPPKSRGSDGRRAFSAHVGESTGATGDTGGHEPVATGPSEMATSLGVAVPLDPFTIEPWPRPRRGRPVRDAPVVRSGPAGPATGPLRTGPGRRRPPQRPPVGIRWPGRPGPRPGGVRT